MQSSESVATRKHNKNSIIEYEAKQSKASNDKDVIVVRLPTFSIGISFQNITESALEMALKSWIISTRLRTCRTSPDPEINSYERRSKRTLKFTIYKPLIIKIKNKINSLKLRSNYAHRGHPG